MSLFKVNSEKTMKFLNNESASSDGLYRPSLDKALNQRDGYKATVRFFPNVIDEQGETGESAIERIMTYVKMKDPKYKSLNGYYDSPKNFGEQCDLTNTYFALDKHDNPVIKENKECLNKVTKFYSYVYIVEDKNQPELEGKILIYQYGWKIKEKIEAEWKGKNPEKAKCDIFDLATGKDFDLNIKEVGGFPNYDTSRFGLVSPLKINGKELPTVEDDGFTMIAPNMQEKVLNFVLAKECNISDYEAKKLTDAERSKIRQIISILSGDTSGGAFDNAAANDDVSAEDIFGGDDAQAAMEALKQLVAEKFGEAE